MQHRLRSCGITNAIYLVENCGSAQHFSLPEDALNQAIINTQVVVCFWIARRVFMIFVMLVLIRSSSDFASPYPGIASLATAC